MARRRTAEILDALPAFKQTREGLTIEGRGWDLNRTDKQQVLETSIRIQGFKCSDAANGGWHLRIIKRKVGRLSASWEATVCRDNERSESIIVGRGYDKGWVGPVHTVRHMDVIGALRKLGQAYFHPGRWTPIRPFKVQYPWKNPEEPNAKYSPFSFRGDVYDSDTDGVTMYFYSEPNASKGPSYAMRDMIRQAGGNAMLETPDANGWCVCWHRDDMATADRMHIDDWRARLIAGS